MKSNWFCFQYENSICYENTEIELEFVPRSGQKNGIASFWCVVCDAEDHEESVTWSPYGKDLK
ncbi:hypothetical protein T07_11924 [Trichinella nelsoni]|uniref:Uncharacterized protein n=1 Tax=Trichinella nelsoni TaxID=6336 RepID=A0A0V0RDT4_9BILA|nr:hypothetical protein T07_7490 [Trichinella nelsoni]KRX17788.1 hypothetical protein T07_11924 [Trichinella nelsoni]